MPRYALCIEYHGGRFAGWQRQSHQPSVQAEIEAALDRIEPDLPAGPHLIAAAGRTDAGVHATGQVAHCDMGRDWDPFRLSQALNAHLRRVPVAVTQAARVPDDFHARFSALRRLYEYRLIVRRAPLTLAEGLAWRTTVPLDAAAMRGAAQHLLGRHDFTTFRSVNCQAHNPVRTLDQLDIIDIPCTTGQEFRFRLSARSFLHNQVRSIVGTLERVGMGALTPVAVGAALAARDRAACGPVAPPEGLTLTGVGYDPDPFG